MPESIKVVILVDFITFLSISLLSFHHESPELLVLYLVEVITQVHSRNTVSLGIFLRISAPDC